MVKRKPSDISEGIIQTINVLDALDEPQGAQAAEILRTLMPNMLRVAGKAGTVKRAGDYTLDGVVQDFGLDYAVKSPFNAGKYHWSIEDSKLDFTTTPYFPSLMDSYGENFNRSSEATCRTALDFILNECLTVLKNNYVDPTAATAEQKTPTPFDGLQIYGEFTFKHKVLPLSTSVTSPMTVRGCFDYGIGRVINLAGEARTHLQCHFQCSLAIVEAKSPFSVGLGVPQLLAYLACLRQSRLKCKQTNASVYGVSSDGYQFLFITITHEGTVKFSDIFNVTHGHWLKVLGWLKFILTETVTTSPNVMPEMR